MNPRRLLLPVLAAALALTACSSTKHGTPASSPAAPTGAMLSKADFLTQMNALCKSTNDAVTAAGSPSGPTDYAAIEAFVPKVIAVHATFTTQAAALVARSSDAAALTTNFLQADARDTATVLPLLNRMLAAAQARDSATVTTVGNQLSNVNDQKVIDYLKGYGLTECATLEGA
jgi:hypothetical protein